MEKQNNERVKIGSMIKRYRLGRGLTAKEVAEGAGIDPSNYSRIEQGKYSVGIDILTRICNEIGCKIFILPIL